MISSEHIGESLILRMRVALGSELAQNSVKYL